MAPPSSRFGRRVPAAPALAVVGAGRVAALGLGAALLVFGPSCAIRALTPADPGDANAVEFQVGQSRLRLPPAFVAAPSTRDALRLALTWPELGSARAPRSAPPEILLVELRAASADDAAERASQRHARFVTADTDTEHGLVGRGFLPGSPYARDRLMQGLADGDVFEALCPGAGAPLGETPSGGARTLPGAPPERCVARWRQGEFDVTLRFSPALLPEWREFRARIGEVLERAAAPAP